ncbi:MAG: phosphatidate cytidylyltransferase [Methylobacillus sp.]|jgi:phosphatidate cytidylyltransferase|nr:phosphatidate cytidylyltransferase [Methylobacillus sp.]
MLKQRMLTAVVLLAGFLAALFYLPELYWDLLMLAVICAAAWEWGRLAGFTPSGAKVFSVLVAMLGIAIIVLTELWILPKDEPFIEMAFFALFMVPVIFWMIAVPLWMKLRPHITNGFFLAAIGFIVLLPTWLAVVGLRDSSPSLLLAVMATVWIADIAAYFVGKRLGRRKLAPTISPGKTWEGVVGALCGIMLYGAALCLIFSVSFWVIPGLLVLVVMSVVGDLFESLLKRQAGLKDSSHLLPGHGGVLDRIDGLTSTLPLACCAIYFFPGLGILNLLQL